MLLSNISSKSENGFFKRSYRRQRSLAQDYLEIYLLAKGDPWFLLFAPPFRKCLLPRPQFQNEAPSDVTKGPDSDPFL